MRCLLEPLDPVSFNAALARVELFEENLEVDVLLAHLADLEHAPLGRVAAVLSVGQVRALIDHLNLLLLLLSSDQLSLLLHRTVVHVLLEESDRVDLRNDLHLRVEAVVLELVATDGFLDERDVRGEVDRELLSDVRYQVEDLQHVELLRDVSLHDLEERVDDLTDVLSERLATLQCVYGLQNLNVEFDLFRGYSIRAYPEEHRYNNVEIVAQYANVKLSDRLHSLNRHLYLMCPLILNQMKYFWKQ